MKILAVYARADVRSGAHKRFLYLLKQLARRKHKVLFVSPYKINAEGVERLSIDIPQAFQTRFHKLNYTVAILRHMRRILNRGKSCDLIVVFGLGNAIPALSIKAFTRKPLVFSMRGRPILFRKLEERQGFVRLKLVDFMIKIILTIADAIVFQNRTDEAELTWKYGVEDARSFVIPNNIITLERGKARESLEMRKILFLGTLSKRKGILTLLKAFETLADKSVVLTVAGTGPLEGDVRRQVSSYGSDVNVKFIGHVNDPITIISQQDLLVVPSLADPFPNVVLEALSAGVPVIGADTGGIAEMLKYEELLFEPSDSDQLSDKLRSLKDRERFEEAKRKCQQRKEAFVFDWVGRFERVFEKVIQKP